ncbi:MAG: hypothetical protein ACI8RD_008211 [Bacillariaceae sp.]|jgi:hypothetical protein
MELIVYVDLYQKFPQRYANTHTHIKLYGNLIDKLFILVLYCIYYILLFLCFDYFFSGSFFQSSLSQTGWSKSFLSSDVPRRALVSGKCPLGAFLRL